MRLIKKIFFKNSIFFLSFFFRTNNKSWIVSLEDGGGSGIAENCLAFAQFLKRKKISLHIISQKKNKTLSKYIVRPFTFKYFKALLFSKYLVVENDLHNDIPGYRERGTFKVNLFHGLALKKIYYSSNYIKNIFKKNTKNFLKKILVGFCYPEDYNLIITSNKIHQKKYLDAFNNKNIKIFFQPRNINLLKNTKRDYYKNYLKKKLNLDIDKKTILYLPTFRDTDKNGYIYDLYSHIEDFNFFLKKNNLQFILKKHNFYNRNPLDKKKILKFNKNFFLDFSKKDYLTQDLLAVADILITDYSGIYFDYLLTERPIIFYCYDYKKYISNDREIYFNYFDKNITPGPKVFNYKDLKKSISFFVKNKNSRYFKKIKKAKNKFHLNANNNCNEDIYNYITNYSS